MANKSKSNSSFLIVIAVCLVLVSELFDEDEYLYEYDEFLEFVK